MKTTKTIKLITIAALAAFTFGTANAGSAIEKAINVAAKVAKQDLAEANIVADQERKADKLFLDSKAANATKASKSTIVSIEKAAKVEKVSLDKIANEASVSFSAASKAFADARKILASANKALNSANKNVDDSIASALQAEIDEKSKLNTFISNLETQLRFAENARVDRLNGFIAEVNETEKARAELRGLTTPRAWTTKAVAKPVVSVKSDATINAEIRAKALLVQNRSNNRAQAEAERKAKLRAELDALEAELELEELNSYNTVKNWN